MAACRPAQSSVKEMDQASDPKILIEEELKKDAPDWRRIERLSRTEVDADESSVRFSVDAAHIQRLGFELVAKQETALAELIKNAYDADATKVQVQFTNHDKVGGTLIIEDDGLGMTADVVRDCWMRISTTNKRDFPVSRRYGRTLAGRKGIGRFAVQRLGKKLELETEVQGESSGLRVKFDWDEGFQPGQLITDIFSTVEVYEKPLNRERTKLTIRELRETWPESTMVRVWKAVLLLQPPFPVSARRTDMVGTQPDPGFEVLINGKSTKQQHRQFSIDSFLDHALATITGEILEDGFAYARVVSPKANLDERQDFDTKFLLTGPIQLSIKYFIYNTESLSGFSFAAATEMARNFGGIRIYRNGFRVLPYGEPADDWLNLDTDVARRNLIAPANNRNFFGQVEINWEDNPLFEETSSREGLIENEAFKELQRFVRDSVEWAILRVAAARERKQTASQKGFVSIARPPRKPSEVIGGLIDVMEARSGGPSQAAPGNNSGEGTLPPAARAAFDQAREELQNYERKVEEWEAAALKYEEMLRILASLGLSITVFGHEIKGIRSAVAANLSVLSEDIENLSTEAERAVLEQDQLNLRAATERMFDLGGYIAGLMSSTESRQLTQVSVLGAIERFIEQFQHYMKKQAIKFDKDIRSPHLRTIEMHSSELDSVLLNFLTNSIKSMKKSKSDPRMVRISAEEDGDFVLISFEDNGGGVPEVIADKIFDPFFTTTMGTDDEGVAGPGTGLGLKIVSDIARSYGGTVELGSPTQGFNCRFDFRVLSSTARRSKQ